MKHYIGTIEERNGEQEYSFNVLFKSNKPDATLRRIALNWYDDCDNKKGEDGGFYFMGGILFTEPDRYKEITAEEYEVIKRTGALPEL